MAQVAYITKHLAALGAIFLSDVSLVLLHHLAAHFSQGEISGDERFPARRARRLSSVLRRLGGADLRFYVGPRGEVNRKSSVHAKADGVHRLLRSCSYAVCFN